MTIVEHLKSMWGPKVRRKTTTIPEVKYDTEKSVGMLMNNDWFYNVTYAFREALDLKFEERKVNKRSYMIWTQGPILNFKNGDTFISKCETNAVQVKYANSMGWDADKHEMYKGSVVYELFKIENGNYKKLSQLACTQVDFLEVLITGCNHVKNV
ncbi:hypothetical protein VIBNISO65_1660020 [Vibrio nigripulchritudo SO65]|uniref:hypothetical protein n=1 Tax=Vibrio nigripulchritudo TaxID=28173 RepID=UPI0003B1B92E|nr:hypothetical protein [Vibrio nigripulchritudo]CCN37194.1 hypothetical protein VIBNIAM115_530003 [Vibrio nigripulchritudo AM115]CCN41442.1 hypothetical protein VIBNIFTn2_1610020 [Vibrio nigripulchritudo FTn2]CCN63690.1 hypothetical protein VIBNIPon4_150020 [Vibrio nigripulchritudo POn4]CCN76795.1 hypothetical protein VIBNISO65_1660020 [Vibrio nigripulchritudo SO65]